MNVHDEHFWMPDGGMDVEISSNSEAFLFEDGCDKVAEGVVWDYFARSYRGVPEAKVLEYATHIRLPAYDAAVW